MRTKTTYHDNGNKKFEGFVDVDNKIQGKFKFFNENGSVCGICGASNGKLNGEGVKYYDNGNIYVTGLFHDGKKNGLCIEYSKEINDQIKKIAIYEEDILNDFYVSYDKNNKKREEINYKDGIKIGNENHYFSTGSINKKIIFDKDVVILFVEYYKNLFKVFDKKSFYYKNKMILFY